MAERERDPEIASLVATTRSIVSEMYRLSADLEKAVDELESYADSYARVRTSVDRRSSRNPEPYHGKERRRGGE